MRKPASLTIAMAAPEAVPYAKSGGLADVAVPLAVLLAVGIVSVLAGGSLLQRRMLRGA